MIFKPKKKDLNLIGSVLFFIWGMGIFLIYFLNLAKRGFDVLLFLGLRSL